MKLLIKYCKELINAIKYKTKDLLVKITNPKIENKIMLTTTQGSYTCNPRAICDEIIKEELPYEIVWAVFDRNISTKELKNQYPKNVKLVVKGTMDFYRELNSSKILVDNENNFGRRYYYKKRKGQFLFETWHGSMGLKKIAVDRGFTSRLIMKKNIKYKKRTDYCISNSDFENNIFRTTYWKNNKILEYGHARNDIFFKSEKSEEVRELNKKVRKYLGLDDKTKFILYAPTFREKNSVKVEIDYKELKKSLESRFGGKWEVVVRFHEKELNAHPNYAKENNIIDATFYPDMQDLMVVSSAGITDYSSWICDYVLTNKPGFLLVPDLEKYDNSERGFYFPLDTTPFPISKNSDELINNIKNFDSKKYEKDQAKFLKDRGCWEDGKASERIVKKIKEVIENGN